MVGDRNYFRRSNVPGAGNGEEGSIFTATELLNVVRHVLPHRIEGDDGPGAHIDRHGRQVYLTRHGRAAVVPRVVPPVVPRAGR